MHKMELKFLTVKTVLLIAITLLHRVSELQALTILEPSLQIHKDILRTNTQFVPKVILPFQVNQSIQLPAFFQDDPKTQAERALLWTCVEHLCTTYRGPKQSVRGTSPSSHMPQCTRPGRRAQP